MPIEKINPYIHYNGTASQAIQLYQSALGAIVEFRQSYGDVPGMSAPPAQKDFVMHASLRIGAGSIMLGDTTPDRPFPAGGNVQIALHFDSLPGMSEAFDALAAGGKVVLPLHDTYWDARFGMLTDAFGVSWMFNCPLTKPEA